MNLTIAQAGSITVHGKAEWNGASYLINDEYREWTTADVGKGKFNKWLNKPMKKDGRR